MEFIHWWLTAIAVFGLSVFVGAANADAWLGATAGILIFIVAMSLIILLVVRDEKRKKEGITY